MPIYALPDGRSVEIDRMPDLVYWHVRIQGQADAEIVGTPLASTLAELLGYRVAHEEWPTWIDDLASEVEGELGGKSIRADLTSRDISAHSRTRTIRSLGPVAVGKGLTIRA